MTLRLVDRLRGIYVLPVNDGLGLLDGKDTFTRNFPSHPFQLEVADCIEALEAGREVDAKPILDKLMLKYDILGIGVECIPMIHREAFTHIVKLISDYKSCDGEQCMDCQDDPSCHILDNGEP